MPLICSSVTAQAIAAEDEQQADQPELDQPGQRRSSPEGCRLHRSFGSNTGRTHRQARTLRTADSLRRVTRSLAENVELLEGAFERWNAGEREVDWDTIDPEVTLHTPLASTRGAPYRGHEGFPQWLADIDDQFESWDLHVDELRELEHDRVLGLGEVDSRSRAASGVELVQPMPGCSHFERASCFGTRCSTNGTKRCGCWACPGLNPRAPT